MLNMLALSNSTGSEKYTGTLAGILGVSVDNSVDMFDSAATFPIRKAAWASKYWVSQIRTWFTPQSGPHMYRIGATMCADLERSPDGQWSFVTIHWILLCGRRDNSDRYDVCVIEEPQSKGMLTPVQSLPAKET